MNLLLSVLKMTMISPFAYSRKDNIPLIVLIGFVMVIMVAMPSLPSPLPLEIPQSISHSNGFFQQALAQQLSINDSPTINKNAPSQNNSDNIMEASGHFANNQIKDGVVTWIQGGYWNLRIIDALNNTSNNNNQTGSNDDDGNNNKNDANFLANFTMIRPDGSLSHNHLINNFSSNNVILSDNDIVVTGMADIHSNNGLEYKQVPLIVHLMGKKVLGLTIEVSKTKGHFASSNEMFGTLISGVGINGSNPAKTTIINSYDPMLNESANKTYRTMMHH